MSLDKDGIITALVAYAGPFDDPRIGWCGHNQSEPNLFRCERCGAEHENCDLIPHHPDCSALHLLKALKAIDKWRKP